jgi:hypothetical protein
MSAKARQMPDEHYSFMELRDLWQRGALTLEECLTHVLHGMIRFESKKAQLDFKLLPYKSSEEGRPLWQSYETLKAQAESGELLQAIEQDKKMVYQAMDFILEQFATLELKFIQMEREGEELIRRMDTSSSHLN